MQQDWRRDPIWQLVGVIFTLTGLVDFVLNLYPDTRLAITLCSIGGCLVGILVLLWGRVVLLWMQGKEHIKSLQPPLRGLNLLNLPVPLVILVSLVTLITFINLNLPIIAGAQQNDFLTSLLSAILAALGAALAVATTFMQQRSLYRREEHLKELVEKMRKPRS